MKKLCALVAAVALAPATAALADGDQAEQCFDKATLTYYDCPVMVAPVEKIWDGPYAGLHGGYGMAEFTGVHDNLNTALSYGDLETNGFVGGGQIGLLHQFDSDLVLGAEADFSLAFIDDSLSNTTQGRIVDSIEAELNWLASARVRAGVALGEILPYVTGGVALANYEVSASQSIIGGAPLDSGSLDETTFGGVVGGGIEFMADEDISIRLEGLYYFFDDSNDTSTMVPTVSDPGDNAGLDDVIVGRIGVNFHF